MKTIIQPTISTILIFIGLTSLTMKEQAEVDGINAYGFPLTFYNYFEGKCNNCYDQYGFKLFSLLADIGITAVIVLLAVRFKNKMFKKATLLIFATISLTSCGQTQKQINLADLKGNWYLNKWTSYNGLIFSNETVFINNSADTVFTLNYSLSHDTLITWSDKPNEKYKNRIINITKDNLVLEGIREVAETRTYTRTKQH